MWRQTLDLLSTVTWRLSGFRCVAAAFVERCCVYITAWLQIEGEGLGLVPTAGFFPCSLLTEEYIEGGDRLDLSLEICHTRIQFSRALFVTQPLAYVYVCVCVLLSQTL